MGHLLGWSKRPIYARFSNDLKKSLKNPFCSLFLDKQVDFFKFEKIFFWKKFFFMTKNQIVFGSDINGKLK